MSHAETADKLLIKPAAGARPAPPRTRGQFIPKARTRRPVTRRVTRGTATTRLATTPDRPTSRVLPSPDRPGFPQRRCRDIQFVARAHPIVGRQPQTEAVPVEPRKFRNDA